MSIQVCLLYTSASSSSVYGNQKKTPFSTEDLVDRPVSLYAATKKSDELMAYTYSHLYNVPATGLRFFTVYGPFGRPDMAYFGFSDKIMAGKAIKIFNQGDMYRDLSLIHILIILPNVVINQGNSIARISLQALVSFWLTKKFL